jgi:hypothetical protein
MITQFLQNHWWEILIYVIIVCILYYLKGFKLREGFQGGIETMGKMSVCPIIKNNIAHSESLLEGFKERGAVTSHERTTSFLADLNKQYTNLGCESNTDPLPNLKPVKTIAEVLEEKGMKLE